MANDLQALKTLRKEFYDAMATNGYPVSEIVIYDDKLHVYTPVIENRHNVICMLTDVMVKAGLDCEFTVESPSSQQPSSNIASKTDREKAIAHIRDAVHILKKAGIKEDLFRLMEKEEEVINNDIVGEDYHDIEYFRCAICGDDDYMELSIKKPKYTSHQYWIEIEHTNYYHDYSMWERLKAACRTFKDIFFKKKEVNCLYIDYEDSRKLKDIINRIPPI